MKLQMKFYLISTIEQIFDHQNNFKIQQTPFLDRLEDLQLNKSFYRTDTDIEQYDGLSIRQIKVVGEVTLEELMEWDMIKYGEFDEICETMGSLTVEYGHLDSLSLSSYGSCYDGMSEGVNCYLSPLPLTIVEPIRTPDTMISKAQSWFADWFEFLKDNVENGFDEEAEDMPSEFFEYDERQLELNFKN